MFVLTIQRRRVSFPFAFWTFRGLLEHLDGLQEISPIIRINHVRTLSKNRAVVISKSGQSPEIFIKRYKGHSKRTQDLLFVNGRAGQ